MKPIMKIFSASLSMSLGLSLLACKPLPNTGGTNPTPSPNSQAISLSFSLSDDTRNAFGASSPIVFSAAKCQGDTPEQTQECNQTHEPSLWVKSFNKSELLPEMKFELANVKAGDSVRVSINGKDRGSCNSAGASQVIELQAGINRIDQSNVAVTDMACIFEVKVSGRVVDESGAPVADAQIEVKSNNAAIESTEKTQTDSNGNYQLNKIPEMVAVNLTVSKSGYQTYQETLSFGPYTQEPPVSVKQADIVLKAAN